MKVKDILNLTHDNQFFDIFSGHYEENGDLYEGSYYYDLQYLHKRDIEKLNILDMEVVKISAYDSSMQITIKDLNVEEILKIVK